MLEASDLRKGLKIVIDGNPCIITHFDFMKPGKGQAVYRCKLKNMIQGNSFDKSFRSGDKMEKANLLSKEVTYSYKDGDAFVFMDNETYEQCLIGEKVLGISQHFLGDEMECEILFFEDTPIEVALPNFIEKEITKSEPGVKGDTATNVTKPAFIESGYELQVPIFVNEGDIVKIDTRTGEYSERVSKK